MTDQIKKWAGPVRPLQSQAEIADHHAIGQLAKIYALGLDSRDYDLARSAFAAEAKVVEKDGDKSIDESLPNTYGVASSFHATQHVISNQYIDLNGDEAVAWSYGVAHHKVAPGESRDEIIAGVQYRDKCKRTGEGWAIVERKVEVLWLDMAPPRSKS